MNILQWLKNKSGKLPVTLAQAAGITAVVGAAGFGALTFLSSPADNNNTFLPPTASQGQVVYVSQNGGGGQYEANGEVGSSFKAAPSRSIQLANRAADIQAQTRALDESGQSPSFGSDVPAGAPTPQAYQLSGADLGQGLGGGKDKALNASLDTFSTIQNQLKGVTEAMNSAQAQAGAAAQAQAQAGKPGAPSAANGQNAAQLASAPRNWGSGGLTHAGGGNGGANSFAIQDSGKNARTRGGAPGEVAQAGDAIAQAQAAMAQLKEGARLPSQSSFGRSDGFATDKDARMSGARRFNKGKTELEFIRKKSAAIAKNKTNAANEAGSPFLASSRISGGLTVNGEQVTTGQTSTSGDFNGKFNNAMRGIGAKMGQVQANMDEREAARDDLKSWMWNLFTTGLVAISAIAVLVLAAKAGNFIWGPILYALAGALTAATLAYIWAGAIKHITNYNAVCGSDGWTTFGWALASILTAGVGLAWTTLPGKLIGDKIPKLITAGLAIVGLGGVGMGLADILKKGDEEQDLSETEKYQQEGDNK